MRLIANALFVGLVAAATFVIFSATSAIGNPNQCNENNPENCPSPTAVCDKGNAVGNPHCLIPTPPSTGTPTATSTVTATSTPTGTPIVTPTQPSSGGGGSLDTPTEDPRPTATNTPVPTPAASPRPTPTVLISPPPIILPPNPQLPKSGN